MGRVTDVRGKPGDLVMLRLTTGSVDVYDSPSPAPDGAPLTVVGHAYPKSLGLILCTAVRGWTLVLWSNPVSLGWTFDGELRCLNQRG